ncbi:uncharacterized protein LOC111387616, partial [Olea europaea var. sylvestris]|uniref:uncharacterized protein LOC111387616 n=1 Tax=Olea europaea var. sylvestris TaxID=158386 RepID=UPI000C1CD4AB
KILGERIICESKLSKLAKVAVIVEGDTWRWPPVHSLALSDLMRDTLATFRPNSNREDVLRWETKLLRFGLVQSMHCVLCDCSVEDLDHLFFAYPFSECVWNTLHAKCNLPWVQWRWPDTLSWMEQFRGKSLSSIVIRLMFAALIYTIWHECNAMTYGEAPKHESAVIRDIIFSICARVNSYRGLVPSNE